MKSSSLPKGIKPYDWAIEQLKVQQAHRITRGSPDVIVAVIDIGYRHHPDLDGHLWINPAPTRGDIHGWDFADNDASLEYIGPDDTVYHRGHHVFIAGEVAAVAPKCPVMILRVGYGENQAGSWAAAVRYAVDHGARIIVQPHGYIQGQAAFGQGMFHRYNIDFGFPFDNTELAEADDYAYKHEVLIFKGTCDNRGRRATYWEGARPPILSIGSSDRRGRPSSHCTDADHVEVAAPCGDKPEYIRTKNPRHMIWGCGGDRNYVAMAGGCMACGFAGGIGALVLSRFPHLRAEELRQVLRNTARGREWNSLLGYGILDASRAVSITDAQMGVDIRIRPQAERKTIKGQRLLQMEIENKGVFDSERTLITLFNGNASKPPVAHNTDVARNPYGIKIIQIGHAISHVRGFSRATAEIALTAYNRKCPDQIWAQAASLDIGCGKSYDNRRLRIAPITDR